MSNSIWHKANEKPELNKYVIVRKHGFAQWEVFKFDNKTTFYEPFTGDLWAYVADVITQADKAELQADKAKRLEKENGAMREEFEVWHGNHKCVLEDKERLQKIAERQNEILQDNFATLGYHIGKEIMDMSDEIKQLIKGE